MGVCLSYARDKPEVRDHKFFVDISVVLILHSILEPDR